uniref:Uncharacterized protein n=1 Tax=Gossypium raimondii TaxID=29730 RepID=A0A0D2PXV3_GOSRA|nr:hypothetical protein B456_002G025000 [Gossypium raimondii]
MGFASFVGRVCFASIFILSAWQMFNEFGVDGGSAGKELAPKLNLAKKHLSSQFHVNFPDIEVRQLVLTAIAMKGLGAILFVFGHGFGAFLLVRISFLSGDYMLISHSSSVLFFLLP